MEALMLDGNAVAGLLREIFAVEMTTAIGTCNGCGAVDAVGAVVKDGARMWIDMRGLRTLELSV
jgi:Family of unknown function (DUF6510)